MKRRRKPALPHISIAFPAAALALCLIAAFVRGLAAAGREDINESPAGNLTVRLYDARKGELLELPLEEYIFGVVASEMPASFADEALMAQAVAARTYAARRIAVLGGEPCGDHGADICSDSACCQAWRSREAHEERWGESAAYYSEKIERAVTGTSGEIALFDGEPIEALYHSASGGATEAAEDVFGASVPYLVSVASPGEEGASHFSDTFTFTAKELVKRVNEAYPKAKLNAKTLEDEFAVLSRSGGGRVTAVRAGESVLTGRQLRGALGLSSAAFTIEFTSNGVELVTRGCGHGVGMSQYGADAMARAGVGYEEILKHYYTGISLGSLYETGP